MITGQRFTWWLRLPLIKFISSDDLNLIGFKLINLLLKSNGTNAWRFRVSILLFLHNFDAAKQIVHIKNLETFFSYAKTKSCVPFDIMLAIRKDWCIKYSQRIQRMRIQEKNCWGRWTFRKNQFVWLYSLISCAYFCCSITWFLQLLVFIKYFYSILSCCHKLVHFNVESKKKIFKFLIFFFCHFLYLMKGFFILVAFIMSTITLWCKLIIIKTNRCSLWKQTLLWN